MLAVGDSISDFSLLNDNGDSVAWSDLRGQPTVFFFYPKASTPGCTKEACAFTELSGAFEELGVRVLGVSKDSVRRQANFREKYTLSMPLLSDPEGALVEGWGVWQEKKNYGRTYMGIVRSTFLVDAQGTVAHVWSPVKVKGHAEAVLATARELLS